MGLFDREYYRDEASPPRLGGADRMMVTNLVILNVAIFIADIFLGRDHWLMETLTLDSSDFAKPWLWWEFVTCGFAHMPYPGMEHILWNMFGLWMFGRDVEVLYGRREFLVFYLMAIVFGSLVWALRHQLVDPDTPASLLGASGAVTAVVLLFVLHYPTRPILLLFILPVPAWVVGILIVGGDVLQMFGPASSRAVAFDVHLAGAAFALAYFKFRWNFTRSFSDVRWIGRSVGRWKPGPRLRIRRPDELGGDEDEEADRILIKVRQEGLDALTSKERRVLEAYSRRMRRKHRSE